MRAAVAYTWKRDKSLAPHSALKQFVGDFVGARALVSHEERR